MTVEQSFTDELFSENSVVVIKKNNQEIFNNTFTALKKSTGFLDLEFKEFIVEASRIVFII